MEKSEKRLVRNEEKRFGNNVHCYWNTWGHICNGTDGQHICNCGFGILVKFAAVLRFCKFFCAVLRFCKFFCAVLRFCKFFCAVLRFRTPFTPPSAILQSTVITLNSGIRNMITDFGAKLNVSNMCCHLPSYTRRIENPHFKRCNNLEPSVSPAPCQRLVAGRETGIMEFVVYSLNFFDWLFTEQQPI